MAAEAKPHGASWSLLFMGWTVALAATLGAIFLGEVMDVAPCVLCWYQRIAMFPLVLIIGAGLLALDFNVIRYALPLATVGWAVALYHYLLYRGVIPKGLVPCGPGADCASAQMEIAGVVSIPLLSLAAFSLIIGLLLAVRKGIAQ